MVRNDFVCSSGSYVSRTHTNSHTRAYSPRIPYLFPKIRAYSCNSTSAVTALNLPKSRGAWTGGPCTAYLYVRMYMCMHGIFIVHVRPSTCAGIRASIRISRFAIAMYSPSHPLFSARRVQFPRLNNPIYTLDYFGNLHRTEGGFQPSPFLVYLFVASVGPSRIPLPTFLRRLLLNRHGRFEETYPRQRFDRAGSARTWLIVTSFSSSLD